VDRRNGAALRHARPGRAAGTSADDWSRYPKEWVMKEIILSFFLISLVVPSTYPEEQREGNIAVASTGRTTESSVDRRAGRCAYFLIFDNEGKFIEAVRNPHEGADKAAGSSAAELLDGKEVALLIAGTVGGKMSEELDKRGIDYIEFTGKVEDALERALDVKP